MPTHKHDNERAYRDRHRALGLCSQCPQKAQLGRSRCAKEIMTPDTLGLVTRLRTTACHVYWSTSEPNSINYRIAVERDALLNEAADALDAALQRIGALERAIEEARELYEANHG